jgi:hypothetical protein
LSIEEQHIALPKLYGAPAYARPAAPVATAPRPFDPDELPIEAFQTDEEREYAASLPARVWAPGGSHDIRHGNRQTYTATGLEDRELRGRPFNIRAIAGRLLGGD